MIWLTWRQHRASLIVMAGSLAAFTTLLLITGLHDHSLYRQDHLADCTASSGNLCGEYAMAFSAAVSDFTSELSWLNFLPAIFGLFLGAPLLARELEHGTHRLVWTQSVTRTRWLLAKVAILGLACVVAAVAFMLIITWWRQPFDALGGRLTPNAFDFEGSVVPAYALFAFALGTLAGALARRTLPALAASLAGYLAVRLAIESFARPHYLAPLHRVAPIAYSPSAARDWLLGSELLGPGGRSVSSAQVIARFNAAGGRNPAAPLGTKGVGSLNAYLHAHGYRVATTYQPASRFWTFQAIETAIFVVLSSALLSTAIWWTRRRLH
jgi:hypothetical protein